MYQMRALVLTSASSGVPRFLLSADIKAGRILPRCRVSASPATDDRKDKARVFTGGDVSCNGQKETYDF